MKKIPAFFFAVMATALSGVAFQIPAAHSISLASGPNPKVNSGTQAFVGEVSDGQCAANGSHNDVMKKARVNSPLNCARGCAGKHGLVLVEAASKNVYKLDDLDKALPFATQKVKITGTLNRATNTIHVVNIEAAK
jgi:hypothetical protein